MERLKTLLMKKPVVFLMGQGRYEFFAKFISESYHSYLQPKTLIARIPYTIVLFSSNSLNGFYETKQGNLLELTSKVDVQVIKTLYIPVSDRKLFSTFLYVFPPDFFEESQGEKLVDWCKDKLTEWVQKAAKIVWFSEMNHDKSENISRLATIKQYMLRAENPTDITVCFLANKNKHGYTDISTENTAIGLTLNTLKEQKICFNFVIIDERRVDRAVFEELFFCTKSPLEKIREVCIRHLKAKEDVFDDFFDDDYMYKIEAKITPSSLEQMTNGEGTSRDFHSLWLLALNKFWDQKVTMEVLMLVKDYLLELVQEEDIVQMVQQAKQQLEHLLKKRFQTLGKANKAKNPESEKRCEMAKAEFSVIVSGFFHKDFKKMLQEDIKARFKHTIILLDPTEGGSNKIWRVK